MKVQNLKFVFVLAFLKINVSSSAPNIVFILADDLGYNDVSWHNKDILTPNLEELAMNGTILDNYYVQPLCTPTRSALMTGYYPIHTGRQHYVLLAQQPSGLYTNFTLMPEYFKEHGYRTHIVGKWHLGYCNEDYLPTRRGFDSFYGFYNGKSQFYNHSKMPTDGIGESGYDFWNNDKPEISANGTYSSYLLADRTVKLIEEHSVNHSGQPLFIYLAFQDPHDPLEVPEEYLQLYQNIQNEERRNYSAKVTALDDAVGKVVDALRRRGLFDNTIIIFSSDNGGDSLQGANNLPLRGNKDTVWEGGTKTVGFIHYSKLKQQMGSKFKGLMHITDWLPTLLTASGIPKKYHQTKTQKIDGLDVWNAIINLDDSPRKEMVYNINPNFGDQHFNDTAIRKMQAAIRVDNMKLIYGDPGTPSGWIPLPVKPSRMIQYPSINESATDFFNYKTKTHIWLFDLAVDPFERVNLAKGNPVMVEKLISRLAVYASTMIMPDAIEESFKGNPNHFSGFWSTGWCKSKPEKIHFSTKSK